MFKRLWSRKSTCVPDKERDLFFESGQAFFEFQCTYGETKIREGIGIFALVENCHADHEFRMQSAKIRVCSADGGFEVEAKTPQADQIPTGTALLETGDIVIWIPQGKIRGHRHLTKSNDERSDWFGWIGAKVAPELLKNQPSATILHKFLNS